MHPEVAGITEGLTAVFTLVRFHPHVPHEVHVELCGCEESAGTHATFEFLLPYMTLTFRSGGTVVGVSITVGPATVVVTVCLPCTRGVAGPWRGGGARGPSSQLLFLVSVLLLLRVLLLRWTVAVWRLVMAVVTVMTIKVRLELRERGALFAAMADLSLGDLRNTCEDIKEGGMFNVNQCRTSGSVASFKSRSTSNHLSSHPSACSSLCCSKRAAAGPGGSLWLYKRTVYRWRGTPPGSVPRGF